MKYASVDADMLIWGEGGKVVIWKFGVVTFYSWESERWREKHINVRLFMNIKILFVVAWCLQIHWKKQPFVKPTPYPHCNVTPRQVRYSEKVLVSCSSAFQWHDVLKVRRLSRRKVSFSFARPICLRSQSSALLCSSWHVSYASA